MRLALIVNPVASSVTRRALVVIQKALSADHELTVWETSRHGQAIRLAHGAARGGADVVLALGGDGTINEVANGVLGEACAIAPLPGGSTNVFARSLGYPNDPIETTGLLLESLAARRIVTASVGIVSQCAPAEGGAVDRAFLFHCGAGFDASVVARVERRGQLKRYLSHPLFIASAGATWWTDREWRRGTLRAEADDGRSVAGAKWVVTLNTTPYTYLGHQPLHLAPEASLDSPLSVVASRSLAPWTVAAAARWIRQPGGVPDKGQTTHWAGVHALMIRSPRPFRYQLDGEIMDPVTELRLAHRPEALRIVVPESPR